MRFVIAQKWLPGLLLGSLAYVLCFPEWNQPFCSIFVLPCFLLAIPHIRSWRQAVVAGLLFSSAVAVGGFYWIVYTVQNFGGLPWFIAVFFLFGYCLIAAPHAYLFFYLGSRYHQNISSRWHPALRSLSWACLFVALEFIARHIKIFPESLGNTLIRYLPLAQNAAWGGVSSLSLMPLLLGASALFAFQEKTRSAYISALGAIVLVVGAWVWGAQELKYLASVPTENIRFTLIQANIGDIEKIVSESGNAEAIHTVLDRYLVQSERAVAEGTDLIVWPETAYPLVFPTVESAKYSASTKLYAETTRARLAKLKTPILFGGYERFDGHDFNSVILLGPDGKWRTSYRKVLLLVIGEYMPLSDWFPSLKKLNPEMGDFGRGMGAYPLLWERDGGKRALQLGANICYEAIMPEYMHGFVTNGAQVFINVTNDSWFGPRGEPWQHLQLAALRTIENRVPFVRATNTGISTGISFTGATIGAGSLFVAQNIRLTMPVPLQAIDSPYRTYGEWFAWLLVICVLGLCVACERRLRLKL